MVGDEVSHAVSHEFSHGVDLGAGLGVSQGVGHEFGHGVGLRGREVSGVAQASEILNCHFFTHSLTLTLLTTVGIGRYRAARATTDT